MILTHLYYVLLYQCILEIKTQKTHLYHKKAKVNSSLPGNYLQILNPQNMNKF